jgi:hypothetical protein
MGPTHCQRLKGLARLHENRVVAHRRFIASDDEIDIERVELDATADPTALVGGVFRDRTVSKNALAPSRP